MRTHSHQVMDFNSVSHLHRHHIKMCGWCQPATQQDLIFHGSEWVQLIW